MISTGTLARSFESAQHSIFRLERLQFYDGDPNFDRFLAGDCWRHTDAKRRWVDLVRRRTAAGVVMQRVHVVVRPWSDYVRFEITWSYPHNVRAGEDVRIMTGTPDNHAGTGDFWMVDDRQVWTMHYDSGGRLTAVEDRSADAAFVVACRKAKGIALAGGEPLGRVAATR